ncbi:MAG: hypothetical protein J5854_05325 [Clostridia bacterium]|nr:hypothetical protein [Clostridia bacterium]
MNTLVIFYSLNGKTYKEAKRIANELGAERYRVVERKPRSALGAATIGRIEAKERAVSHIDPIAVRLSDYDRVVLMAPLWGGYPAPAFNNMVMELEKGQEVGIVLTSEEGELKDEEGLIRFVEKTGAKVIGVSVMNIGKK